MGDTGVTTITLKRINKSKVYQYIYRERVTSKLQIVRDLQMGLSTVGQNLTVLEQDGLIERNGYFESTGGRKAQAIRIAADNKISIGVGILKKRVHLAAVNLYGEAVSVETFPMNYNNRESYYQQVADRIRQFIEERGYKEDRILGVSISSQGVLTPDGEMVAYGAVLNNEGMKLSDFSARLPYPCRLENDSNAAAYLELWNHSDLDSAVVFLLNNNLGGAVITDYTVQQGVSRHSGSIEHMCINPDGPMCYCGNRGCLEAYCSAAALETAARMPAKEFFSIIRVENNEPMSQIWKDYLDHLAFAMKNLNMVIDSPMIVSGYLAQWFTEEDFSYLLKKINRLSPFTHGREQLILGTQGEYTSAVGAALYYVKEFIAAV